MHALNPGATLFSCLAKHIYGFMVMKVQGPTLLTGGSFGIEASLIPVILGLLVSAVFLLCRGRDIMIGSRT